MNYENDQELHKIIEEIRHIVTSKNTIGEDFHFKGEIIELFVTAISDEEWDKREDKSKRKYQINVNNKELEKFIKKEISELA